MIKRRNSGRPWKREDDFLFCKLVAARSPSVVLARKPGRTQGAIRGRAAHLGIMLPSAMRPWKISLPRGPRSVLRLKPAEMPEMEDDNA